MQRYDSYKDSRVKWLGEIPSHWEMRKAKFLWKESFAVSETGKEELLSVSQYDGVLPAKTDSRSESLKGYKKVYENDLVINIMLAWLGGLGVSKFEGLVSPAYCTYKLIHDSNPRFLHYLYKTPLYLAEFARHSTGVVPSRWRMYTDDFGQVLTLLPPTNEQEAIANYLDAATSKLDAAIAQQQKMIDLLNERKQIIINNAVTKGLNSNVQMKPSGIDWIGDIPEHWKMIALKYLGTTNKTLVNTQNHPQAYYYEYSMPAYDEGKCPKSVLGSDIDSTKISLAQPTLLINKLNAHKRRIWFVDRPMENSVASTEFVPIIVTKANPFFIELILKSDKTTTYLMNNSNGATNSQKRVSTDVIMGIKIPIPSDDEQIEIVDYVNSIITPLNMAIDNCIKKIAYLQERKQIIINDVVTGKVKVI